MSNHMKPETKIDHAICTKLLELGTVAIRVPAGHQTLNTHVWTFQRDTVFDAYMFRSVFDLIKKHVKSCCTDSGLAIVLLEPTKILEQKDQVQISYSIMINHGARNV